MLYRENYLTANKVLNNKLNAIDLRIHDVHVTSLWWLTPNGNSPNYPKLRTHSCVFIVNRIQVVTSEKESQTNGRSWELFSRCPCCISMQAAFLRPSAFQHHICQHTRSELDHWCACRMRCRASKCFCWSDNIIQNNRPNIVRFPEMSRFQVLKGHRISKLKWYNI